MPATIEYQLNGHHIDGWDEDRPDGVTALDAAESARHNLTDWQPGDELTATISDLDELGRKVEIDSATVTL